ncbi:hypothetical protein [Rhizobium fabae]|uniref:Catechol-2,3-dioxygenase n=1 Tax=Rhizobium fabae TaxID=573179 RepID=A0A7W6B4V7_9HYPH|nr:hypothetical protein [Rhizobium fabae]MBB3913884.1 catechol-2,3-dioxygenase [Rhizobium fabae]RUM16300.1 hypothetical protein EFB14_02975 [Rhizobium fabae]
MKNAERRLVRLEQKAAADVGHISWDWANDPYYLGLPVEKQEQMGLIMEKIRPHLPHNPTAAMMGLSLEELDELEKFYIARFGIEELSRVAQEAKLLPV